MQKKLTARLPAIAVLALTSGFAAAQTTVTLYGNVDAGVLTRNHAPTANGTGASSTTLANGGISPSIWGFKGGEDLGDGLKAVFNLEGHFYADTGATDPRLFRRQSNVGLSSASLGTVMLGNMYSPAILAFASTDPRGLRENFSGLYSWAYNSGALTAGNNGNNDVGVFLQNALSYNNTIGPVGLSGAYSISEFRGAVTSLGATYSGGPLALSAAYQGTNRPNSSDRLSSIYTVGAGYTWGNFTGKLNYLRGVNKNVALVETSRVDVYGAGLDWRTAANNTVIAAIYYGKDKDNSADKTTTLLLSDEYALSKRTTLYAQLGYAKANTGATLLTTVVAGGTMADANTALLNLGIKHSF